MGVAASSRNRITRAGIDDGEQLDNVYAGWYRRFMILFAVLVAAVIAGVILDPDMAPWPTTVVVGTVVAMVFWYWFVGQWQNISSDTHAVIYLLGNIVGVTITISLWNTSALLLFAVYWFGFAYLYTRYAVAYAFLLTLATQWAFGSLRGNIGFDLDTAIGAAVLIALLACSGMMAKYLEAFHNEAARNEALVEELKRTQQTLMEREREAGVEQERRRMAGEIHDTIAQHFASILTNLRAASDTTGSDPTVTQKHLNHAFSAAQQGIIDSRAMLSIMQPDILLGRVLTDVLRTISTEWSEYTSVPVSFAQEGEPVQLTRDQESILVRGLQESLRNIAKHAQAESVTVSVAWLEDEVLLDVSDNGIGFEPDALGAGPAGYQMGLASMQSRVESAGGTFALESSPGEGTSIAIAFPTGGSA